MNLTLIVCDNCSNDVEVAHMLTSTAPFGYRVICEDCFDKKFRLHNLYHLRMVYAWDK